MLTIETFKKELGDVALTMTDEQIRHLYELTERLAGALFDMWVKNLSNSKG